MTNFPIPYSSLKRSQKRIAPRRHPEKRVGKLGIVRLSGEAMERLREECFVRDSGHCRQCGKLIWYCTSWAGDPDRYHMAHIRNKRMYGDTLENVRALCGDCHRAEHGNPKGTKE